MSRRLLGLAVVFALASACSSTGSSSVTASGQLGDPAAMVDFTRGISVPEGSAASVHISVRIDSDQVIAGIDVKSADPTVLRVVRSASDTSEYVFLGVSAGTTSVQVSAGGRPVQTVSASVPVPPSSSLPLALNPPVQPVAPAGDGGPDDDAGVTPNSDARAPDVDAGAPDGSDRDASAPDGDASGPDGDAASSSG
jgi:hypothetical protein